MKNILQFSWIYKNYTKEEHVQIFANIRKIRNIEYYKYLHPLPSYGRQTGCMDYWDVEIDELEQQFNENDPNPQEITLSAEDQASWSGGH